MELAEPIELINDLLKSHYGVDTVSGDSIWRVVWSEDQYEKRFGTYDDITPSGVYIRTVTEFRLVPKYKQWIHEKFVLERLVLVQAQNEHELTTKVSYEPIYVFEDANNNYLPPKFIAAKWVVDCIYAVQYGTDHSLSRYVSNENSQEESLELKKQRVDEIYKSMFGEPQLPGLVVSVPSNYNGNKES
jgi:hypothetical protein